MVGVDKSGIAMPHGSKDLGKFPAGLRVLAVDDDPTCLRVLAQTLKKCSYEVTMCTRATEALSLLREKKNGFDLVISDVFMPDMDGFKLLELVGLEMDLPVIMTSSHGETSVVMKGIVHGACDYLIKPVRTEELRNIWQHVVRRKRNGARDVDATGSVEDNDKQQHQQQQQHHNQNHHQQQRRVSTTEEVDHTSSANDGGGDANWKLSKRRKDDSDELEHESDDPSTLKKQRVVWSVELHQQFVNAVNQLGLDKAVPKKILESMSVHGLTRENVASHLQKYRLYLRRLSGVQSQAGAAAANGHGVSFGESSFAAMNGLADLRSLVPPPTGPLTSIQGSLGRTPANLVDSSVLMQLSPSSQGGAYFNNRPQAAVTATPLVPAPLMSIPSRRSFDNGLEQVSPRSPVDDFPFQQYQFNPNSRSSSFLVPQQAQQQAQQQHQTCEQHSFAENSNASFTSDHHHHQQALPHSLFTKSGVLGGGCGVVNFHQQQQQQQHQHQQQSCSNSFGSRMAGLNLHDQQQQQQQQEEGFGSGLGVLAKFPGEAGSRTFGAMQSAMLDNFPVKLEGESSSGNQDDLFSMFMK